MSREDTTVKNDNDYVKVCGACGTRIAYSRDTRRWMDWDGITGGECPQGTPQMGRRHLPEGHPNVKRDYAPANPAMLEEATDREYVWLTEGEPNKGTLRRWADDVAAQLYSGGPPPMVVYVANASRTLLVRAFPELIKTYQDENDFMYSTYRFREEPTGCALGEVTVKIDGRV